MSRLVVLSLFFALIALSKSNFPSCDDLVSDLALKNLTVFTNAQGVKNIRQVECTVDENGERR